jgi:hypothetical protein
MAEVAILLLILLFFLGFACLGFSMLLNPQNGIRFLEWFSGVEWKWPVAISRSWIFSPVQWRIAGLAMVVMGGYVIYGIVLRLVELTSNGIPPSARSEADSNWLPLIISMAMITAGISSLVWQNVVNRWVLRLLPGRLRPTDSTRTVFPTGRNLGIWLILAGIVASVAWLSNS